MANGWTSERRAKQAALIFDWKPWERSTGAKTPAGKFNSSRNAKKPDSPNRQTREAKTQIAALLAQVTEMNALLK